MTVVGLDGFSLADCRPCRCRMQNGHVEKAHRADWTVNVDKKPFASALPDRSSANFFTRKRCRYMRKTERLQEGIREDLLG